MVWVLRLDVYNRMKPAAGWREKNSAEQSLCGHIDGAAGAPSRAQMCRHIICS